MQPASYPEYPAQYTVADRDTTDTVTVGPNRAEAIDIASSELGLCVLFANSFIRRLLIMEKNMIFSLFVILLLIKADG